MCEVCVCSGHALWVLGIKEGPYYVLSVHARGSVMSVCLSSTLEPAAIRMLQLQSQQCLHGTLKCLNERRRIFDKSFGKEARFV